MNKTILLSVLVLARSMSAQSASRCDGYQSVPASYEKCMAKVMPLSPFGVLSPTTNPADTRKLEIRTDFADFNAIDSNLALLSEKEKQEFQELSPKNHPVSVSELRRGSENFKEERLAMRDKLREIKAIADKLCKRYHCDKKERKR